MFGCSPDQGQGRDLPRRIRDRDHHGLPRRWLRRDKTPYGKLAQAFARTRLGGWLFVHVFPVFDRRLIPLTGVRLAVAVGQPMLLLHTRGARSGQPRSTPQQGRRCSLHVSQPNAPSSRGQKRRLQGESETSLVAADARVSVHGVGSADLDGMLRGKSQTRLRHRPGGPRYRSARGQLIGYAQIATCVLDYLTQCNLVLAAGTPSEYDPCLRAEHGGRMIWARLLRRDHGLSAFKKRHGAGRD